MTTVKKDHWKRRKVVIVGAGAVGSTFAYALAKGGLSDEIVLLDKNRELMEGQVLDLAHGLPFLPAVHIRTGRTSDYADARVIVLTAGANQKPGESRLNLLRKNAGIVEGIVEEIVKHNSHAVIVVVSNPVDVLTHVALMKSGLPRGRVIGSGTVLDSARFRYLLGRHCNVDVHNVHAYILGEHGDSEFAAWSLTNIAGIPFDSYCSMCGKCGNYTEERRKIVEEVKNSAYHIIDYKGATYYAIGLALVKIIESILHNRRSVLTVSTLLQGEYGIENVCLGVPALLTQNGVEKVLEASLLPDEQKALSHSASVLKKAVAELQQSS
jgi:L-lactate dehydrogenase